MKTKGNLMYRLLKIYSVTLMVMITLFSISVGLFSGRDNQEQAERLNRNSMLRVSSFVEENQKKVKQLAYKMVDSEREYQGISSYFALSIPEYLAYTLDNDYKRSNLQVNVRDMYGDDDVEAITIDFTTSKERFLSTKKNKNGEKVAMLEQLSGVKFSQVMENPVTWKPMGTLNMVVDQQPLTEILQELSKDYTSDVFLISERNQLVYTNSQNQELLKAIKKELTQNKGLQLDHFESDYFISATVSNRYQVLSLINRGTVSRNSRSFMFGMIAFSIVIEGVLLVLLFRLFNGYVYQVEDILTSVNKVSGGNRASRLKITDKKAELKDISVGINEMLESLDAFIRENYELELRQKEADFRALQAQINPHFMYNTLEYIRMYALSEGMVELSEVVFAFASILRNNISHKKMISLEREMKFVEQYVYLYQMRYPKSIAYSFKIEKELASFEIPKFCLQPLVENYFAHGIDFTRSNNVISVYTYLDNQVVEIIVRDNGLGIAAAKRAEINEYLKTGNHYPNQSIGIQNVNERLKIIFGPRYQMVYEETVGGGTTIRITIQLEEEVECIK